MIPFTPHFLVTPSHSHLQTIALGQIYAGVMILLYPVGIPMLFTYLLAMHHDKINPSVANGASTPTLGVVNAQCFPSRRSYSRDRSSSSSGTEATLTTSHRIYEDKVPPVRRMGTALGGRETSSHGDDVRSVEGTQDVLDSANMPTANAHREEVNT